MNDHDHIKVKTNLTVRATCTRYVLNRMLLVQNIASVFI